MRPRHQTTGASSLISSHFMLYPTVLGSIQNQHQRRHQHHYTSHGVAVLEAQTSAISRCSYSFRSRREAYVPWGFGGMVLRVGRAGKGGRGPQRLRPRPGAWARNVCALRARGICSCCVLRERNPQRLHPVGTAVTSCGALGAPRPAAQAPCGHAARSGCALRGARPAVGAPCGHRGPMRL